MRSAARQHCAEQSDERGDLDSDNPDELARDLIVEPVDPTLKAFEPALGCLEAGVHPVFEGRESCFESRIETSDRVQNPREGVRVLFHFSFEIRNPFFKRRHRAPPSAYRVGESPQRQRSGDAESLPSTFPNGIDGRRSQRGKTCVRRRFMTLQILQPYLSIVAVTSTRTRRSVAGAEVSDATIVLPSSTMTVNCRRVRAPRCFAPVKSGR